MSRHQCYLSVRNAAAFRRRRLSGDWQHLPASPPGAVDVPKCGDRDYREALPGCQAKNTRSCASARDDTIMLIFSHLRQHSSRRSSPEMGDSSGMAERIRNDTKIHLFNIEDELSLIIFSSS
jgi:hypothetical protein